MTYRLLGVALVAACVVLYRHRRPARLGRVVMIIVLLVPFTYGVQAILTG